MISAEAKQLARDVYRVISFLHRQQVEPSLAQKAIDRCTSYQDTVIQAFQEDGYDGGTVTDVDAKVTDLQDTGHSIGILQTKKTKELVAFDATIAQNGETHWSRRARIWFGTAEKISQQLKKEFGGEWEPFDIEGAVLFTRDSLRWGEYRSNA